MAQQGGRRQLVKFTFFKVDPAWRRLDPATRAESKRAFVAALEETPDLLVCRTYSTIGTRGDCDFMIWTAAYELEAFQRLMTRLYSTPLGGYLTTPYSYLSMTRRSPYVEKHHHEGQEGTRVTLEPGEGRYLFVYPFVKQRRWYRLTKQARQGMMNEHIEIGHKYPTVRLNTTYSFGLDDQEFVLAFDSDSPVDFLELVAELRESEASSYTERDTPIFTCIKVSPGEMLDALGG